MLVGILVSIASTHKAHCSCQRLAVVPVTIQPLTSRADTDVPYHPSYEGLALFKNTFEGQLPATDYPKVNVSYKTT